MPDLLAKNPLRLLPGGIVEIGLTRGKVALIDLADLPKVVTYRWHAGPRHRAGARHELWYAVWAGKPKRYLHQVVAGYRHVDHVNTDGLDCRRENLRPATQGPNARNARRRSDNTAGYKGVTWHKQRGKWMAQIHVDGRHLFLGSHESAEAAAQAYDRAARTYFGEYARLNFPPEEKPCVLH